MGLCLWKLNEQKKTKKKSRKTKENEKKMKDNEKKRKEREKSKKKQKKRKKNNLSEKKIVQYGYNNRTIPALKKLSNMANHCQIGSYYPGNGTYQLSPSNK